MSTTSRWNRGICYCFVSDIIRPYRPSQLHFPTVMTSLMLPERALRVSNTILHVEQQQCLEASVLDLNSAALKTGCHRKMESGAPQSVSCHGIVLRAAYATAASVNKKTLPFLRACHSVNPQMQANIRKHGHTPRSCFLPKKG